MYLYKMNIGEIIREARKADKKTQKQLADECGVTIPTLTAIEKNTGNVGIKTIHKIAERLGYDLILMPKS